MKFDLFNEIISILYFVFIIGWTFWCSSTFMADNKWYAFLISGYFVAGILWALIICFHGDKK